MSIPSAVLGHGYFGRFLDRYTWDHRERAAAYPCVVTATGSGSITAERSDVRPSDGGDSERFAHYADRDKITEAMVTGTPVVALCGKVWVPSRDPTKYPLCPECKLLFDLGPDGRMREWREHAGGS
jgi:hypothetical protein